MADRKILVVDDDKKTVDLIRMYLEKDGYRVWAAYDGRQALEQARQRRPDLVVLDLMLPEVDGLDVCRILRAESKIPVIMLTARTTEEDKLLGLDLGADDYVSKPFSPRELLARVRAVLRRAGEEQEKGPPELRFGDLTVDLLRHVVKIRGEAVTLTPTEFKLLEILVKEPGRAFSRLELVDRVLGFDYEGLERTVDTHVLNLRKKIEPDPTQPIYIQTVYGVGYKLNETLPPKGGTPFAPAPPILPRTQDGVPRTRDGVPGGEDPTGEYLPPRGGTEYLGEMAGVA